MSDIALQHIEHLSVAIGPRGTGTEKEREACDYVERTLADLGYETHRDAVQVAPSAYRPYILALAVMIVAVWLFIAFGGAGALAASTISLIVTISVYLELTFRDNPLHWFLPVAFGQNVYAIARPSGEARRKIVVTAHADTHRTPLIWRSPETFLIYRLISALGMIALPLGTILFLVGIFARPDVFRPLALALGVIYAILLAIVLQAEFTKHSPGANDNASGVGVMLSLAARLKRQPLAESEVWFVATTAEETGLAGIRDFVRRHREELHGTVFLNVDNVAGKDAGPCYLRSETFFTPLKYSPDMLELADQVAADRPELGAYSWNQTGTYTDGATPLKAGFRTLTWVGYTKKGWIPNWHSQKDTFDQIDAGAVDRTEEMVWEMMKRVGER